LRTPLYFWRDNSGREVDLVIETGNRLIPVEIKAGKTPGSDFFRGLVHYNALSGDRCGILIYGGDESHRKGDFLIRAWWDFS